LAYELTAAAQGLALLLASAVSLVFLGISLWEMTVGNYQLAAGWAVYAGGALSLFYVQQYLQTTYRTSMEFARLALVN